MDLTNLQNTIAAQGACPPVDAWNPAFCGQIDLVIKRDGSWHYMGTPIRRQQLVKLFASVLKKEDDRYFLVTPVEKVGIRVEDVPFVVTEWRTEEGFIIVCTSLGDKVVISAENPLALKFCHYQQDELPYVHIRRDLWGRLHQNVFYQMIELGEEIPKDKQRTILQLKSGDYCFSLGETETFNKI